MTPSAESLLATALAVSMLGCESDRSPADSRAERAMEDHRAEAFREQVESRLRALDARWEDLLTRAEAAGEALGAELPRNLEKLDADRRELRLLVARLNDATNTRWSELRTEIDDAFGEMERAFDRLDDKL